MSFTKPSLFVGALIFQPKDSSSVLLMQFGKHLPWELPRCEVGCLSFREAIEAVLKTHFGITEFEMDERACLPHQFISYEQDRHVVTLYFPVILPKGALVAPTFTEVGIHWWPLDPCPCLPQAFVLSESTAEIIRRVSEAK